MNNHKVTIVAATEKEMEPLQKQFANNAAIDFLCTGVGCMAATFAITNYLQFHTTNYLIQVGIAGSFVAIPLGSIVAIEQEFMADVGVEEDSEFKDVFDMQLVNSNSFPYTNKALINTYLKKFSLLEIPIYNGVTVNEISTHSKRIQQLKTKYNAAIETMEGAALHYVALQKNIPFLQLRGISNMVGDRNKKNWDFVNSIANVNAVASNTIQALL